MPFLHARHGFFRKNTFFNMKSTKDIGSWCGRQEIGRKSLRLHCEKGEELTERISAWRGTFEKVHCTKSAHETHLCFKPNIIRFGFIDWSTRRVRFSTRPAQNVGQENRQGETESCCCYEIALKNFLLNFCKDFCLFLVLYYQYLPFFKYVCLFRVLFLYFLIDLVCRLQWCVFID